MTPEQTDLIERVRALIADETAMREMSMFGGRSVMVNEKMIVSAGKGGGLLVRVNADRHDELLSRPGAMQAEMGPGRDMGRAGSKSQPTRSATTSSYPPGSRSRWTTTG